VKVRLTPRALAEAKRCKTWWRKNRPAAPELFEEELRAALALLLTTPVMGAPYEGQVGFPVRRVLLKKTAYHVYFGLNGDELVVLSVWGARRKRGPKL
jgi:plasmid stabilization system protein ParE